MVTVLAGLFSYWLTGASPAVGVMAGGGVCLLTTIVFSLRIFSGDIEFEPRRFLRRLVRAEMQKILLTVFLFIAAIKLTHVHHAGFLLGFIVVTLMSWLLLPLAAGYLAGKSKD